MTSTTALPLDDRWLTRVIARQLADHPDGPTVAAQLDQLATIVAARSVADAWYAAVIRDALDQYRTLA